MRPRAEKKLWLHANSIDLAVKSWLRTNNQQRIFESNKLMRWYRIIHEIGLNTMRKWLGSLLFSFLKFGLRKIIIPRDPFKPPAKEVFDFDFRKLDPKVVSLLHHQTKLGSQLILFSHSRFTLLEQLERCLEIDSAGPLHTKGPVSFAPLVSGSPILDLMGSHFQNRLAATLS